MTTSRSPGYINSDQVGVSVHSHPHDDVCVGYAHRCDGSEHGATKSVGRRQSFSREGSVFVVETHPLEFDGEPYDEILTVELAG